MKKLVFALTVLIALQYGLNAQNCYIRLSDDSGVAPSQEQLTALENAACRLRDSLPLAFRDSFKVFDFGFYLHNENMTGGYPEVFQQAIAQAGAQSKYYLLFGKQTDKTGVYTKFWVALKMPTTAQFSCMTALQREVFNKRVEAKTKSRYEEEQYLYYSYHKAEIEGIEELIQIINEIKDCCIVADRNGLAEWATGCIGCNEDLARDFFKLENFENFQLNISSAQFADIRSERIRDYSFHKVNYNGGSTHIGQIIESEIEKMNHWFSMNLLITSYESLCIDSIINQDQFSYAEDFHCWINFPTGSGNKSIDIKVTWNKKSNSWIKNQSTANLITNVIKCQILNFLTQSVNFCFETDGIPPEVINIAEYSEFDYFYAIYILNQTSEITMNDLFNAYDDFGGYEPSPQPPPIDEIQNGIDILSTSVAFSVPTTGTLIGRSHRNPPNVEDMQHGTNGDCTGVKFKCMTYIPPSCPQCPENYLDEGELKEYMLALMTFFSKDPLENIAVSFAERFFNKISSDHYSTELSEHVKNSPNMRNYIKLFGAALNERLRANGGNIYLNPILEMPSNIRPVFGGNYNRWNGLTILLNDTEMTDVWYMGNFNLNNDTKVWSADFYFEVTDHFGLDKHDAIEYQSYHTGFAAWWALQHRWNYPPFRTKITIFATLRGTL